MKRRKSSIAVSYTHLDVYKRQVVVRITDRGDLFEGRVIDLSYGAAAKLAMTKDGLAPVKLEVLSLGKSHRDQ